ncbi:rhodanese-like domain-containing protein [Paenibacillus tarimensis]|uniref:rhodanese-like domain-containing protein n=1 Tax=Paenibacillus tarimensis TaxID=416012 RepID=UPI001F42DCC4|nr:rhodanese-like domain-containing protein [Paenibacillus tarimensis]MCF2942506.1 rhodanese-like domain-containing protein [Paenibacillus tarimensis]
MADEWEDISPVELFKRLEEGRVDTASIIDVREQEEWDYYHLPGTKHIPMSTIQESLQSLPKEREWYILCAHGVRSIHVCSYMSRQGYSRLRNITGGIAAAALLNGFQYD